VARMGTGTPTANIRARYPSGNGPKSHSEPSVVLRDWSRKQAMVWVGVFTGPSTIGHGRHRWVKTEDVDGV